jgi:sarcosine/dimethylglycine N-methyltransferase
MAKDDVAKTAENYYDSHDADNFYFHVWGGEDIHVGLYNYDGEPTYDASQRSVEKMTTLPKNTSKDINAVDIGAGYGGTARYFSEKFGFPIDCLNISEAENDLNRKKNKERGLDGRVKVYYGNFEELPFEDNSYELAIAQDAILHSANKKKVFEEVDRVLKPGGEFVFTDPMQADDAPKDDVLKPILERIHLDHLGSVKQYREFAKALGWEEVQIIEMPDQLVNHYSTVRNTLIEKEPELKGKISQEYIDKMKDGLWHWINGGKKGYLNWGFIHFRKPAK